jgi:uncharacterized protein YbjQ (UPF0145 family)
LVTTTFIPPGYEVAENLDIMRGLTLRSRSIVGNFLRRIRSLFGGRITIYSELCEKARLAAFDMMCRHAKMRNVDAIIGMHYDALK